VGNFEVNNYKSNESQKEIFLRSSVIENGDFVGHSSPCEF